MNVIIIGVKGAMGQFVANAVKARGHNVLAGVDIYASPTDNYGYPVFADFTTVPKGDVIIDFSHHSAVNAILEYAISSKTPVVLCTTGYTAEELEQVSAATKSIAVFRSGNMSMGINVLLKLVRECVKLIGDKADIEIIEQHHNRKIDAPSGTALMIAETVKSVAKDTDFIYGRQGNVGKRPKDEVAIHAVRGGTIVGKHEVLFAMGNEVLSIKHEAESREIFAEGSVDAALFVKDKGPGLYNMQDVLD